MNTALIKSHLIKWLVGSDTVIMNANLANGQIIINGPTNTFIENVVVTRDSMSFTEMVDYLLARNMITDEQHEEISLKIRLIGEDE